MMKKYRVLAIALPLLAACSTQPKVAHISGTVGGDAKQILLAIGDDVDTLAITDGSFQCAKELSQPTFASLRLNRSELGVYLIPGASLSLQTDAALQNVSFSGDNADFMQQMRRADSSLNALLGQWRTLYALDETQFSARIDSVINAVKPTSSNSQLTQFEAERLGYSRLACEIGYPRTHAYLMGLAPGEEDAAGAFGTFNPNNEQHLMFPSYRELLSTYVNVKASGDEDDELVVRFAQIDSLISAPKCRDYVKMIALSNRLSYGAFHRIGDAISKFAAESKTPAYTTRLKKRFDELMATLAPGKPAPSLEAKNMGNEPVGLEQFKGNLVYIDFWATWCGPCRAELPHLEKLQEDYKGKPIVFISLSLDDDADAWQKMVNEKQMKGIQLHAEGAWRSPAATAYSLRAIPTFCLVGADGNIIDPRAPRPSTEDVRALFDAELAKL